MPPHANTELTYILYSYSYRLLGPAVPAIPHHYVHCSYHYQPSALICAQAWVHRPELDCLQALFPGCAWCEGLLEPFVLCQLPGHHCWNGGSHSLEQKWAHCKVTPHAEDSWLSIDPCAQPHSCEGSLGHYCCRVFGEGNICTDRASFQVPPIEVSQKRQCSLISFELNMRNWPL